MHLSTVLQRGYITLAAGVALLGFLAYPVATEAFNMNAIISDEDMTDHTRMSPTQIQQFLTQKGGILKDYTTADLDGVQRTAAEIIYNASVRYRLNPQFLISRLQVESSLVTGNNTFRLDWAMGYAVCDSCSLSDPRVVQYKGFAKQMDAAGNSFRNGYLADLEARNSTISGWGVGRTKTTLDGVAITPLNKATAVLYTYTPWLGYYGGASNVGGNSLFYDVMEGFFPNRSSGQHANRYIEYPDGSLLQDTETGTVYKLEKGKLRAFVSRSALLSNYDLRKIIGVTVEDLSRYEVGSSIFLPKYIYVQDPAGGVHLIDNIHRRRAIPSREIMRQLGVNPEEIIPITYAERDLIPEGPPLIGGAYPSGGLIQNRVTGAVMYLNPKQKLRPIWSRDVMENQFRGYSIIPESPEFFESHEKRLPVKFSNGTLVKYAYRDMVYLIEGGKKRPVTSMKILNELGGFGNVIVTYDKAVLKLHEGGEPVSYTKAGSSSQSVSITKEELEADTATKVTSDVDNSPSTASVSAVNESNDALSDDQLEEQEASVGEESVSVSVTQVRAE